MNMDFTLQEKHRILQQKFREFAQKEVKPFASITDETECFPKDIIQKIAKKGWLGLPFSKKYGGLDDYFAYILCVEELSKVCATTGLIVSVHTSLCGGAISSYGTELQKEVYLQKLCTGEYLGAFALTELEAGTDVANMKTKATLDGEHYILNGSKMFITNAQYADLFIVFAVTDESLGVKGISAFLVEKNVKGLSVGKEIRKMGLRGSSTCELHFEHCKIHKKNRLGKEGEGFLIAMNCLDNGRIGVATQALGIAEGALEETISYTKSRNQFGKSISSFQNSSFELAELQVQTEAAKLLVYKAAWCVVKGEKITAEAAMAKLFASNVANEVTRRGLQLFGGYGYTRDYPLERMMRDAKITEIYEGTSEVQKMVISSMILREKK